MARTKHILAVLFTLIAAAAARPTGSYCLEPIDMRVLESADECRYRSMDCFMTDVSEAWNPENLILASLPVMALGDDRAFRCLELAWKSMLISESTTAALKWTVNRERPDGEPHSRANSSFPSSHASSSFAVAFSVSTYYPRWTIPAYGMAALISYSRVYLDAHHPGDVIVGAGIGVLGGYLANRYLRRWHVDRGEVLSQIPIRVEAGEGLGSVKIYFSRRIR
ncbi:MAG: phosphatase PAP2 family protein [bacterium]|jgi:hypothetical protein